MICARCGTEHNDPEKICPRCFYGRPNQKRKMPKWAVWVTCSLCAAVVVGIITLKIVTAVQLDISQRWIDGTWENKNMALIINQDGRRFHLIHEQVVLVGEYRLDETELRLISEDGKHYVYFYERVDDTTLDISFDDGQRLVQETLTKLDYSEQ